jgi:hypothetical protein
MVNSFSQPSLNRRNCKPTKVQLFVGNSSDYLGLFTHNPIKKGKTVTSFAGRIVPFVDANSKSLQLSSQLFLRGPGNSLDEFINHSCEPNCTVSFQKVIPYAVAVRDILPGEEITFNYNSIKWDLLEQEEVFGEQSAFVCLCKSRLCVGQVRGFNHLSLHQKIRLSSSLSPFLRLKLMEAIWAEQIREHMDSSQPVLSLVT